MSLYLDHNATTPPAPEVLDAMAAALRDLPGNPSSPHGPGRAARAAIERARAEVAALIGATPEEIVFTSGGTEGNELAIRGLLRGSRVTRGGPGRQHVVSSPIEHPSVLGALAAADVDLTLLPVAGDGTIDPQALRAALRPETTLVTLALANHELGNVYDLATLAEIAHEGGALFHADAVQAAGKIPVDVHALGVDAVTLSAHKIHGPKGSGAIFLRRGAPFEPAGRGGHQERERRAGTENVAGIAGFGAAASMAERGLAAFAAQAEWRDAAQARLMQHANITVFGADAKRLPSVLCFATPGFDAERQVMALDLDGVMVSAGAACSSGKVTPSHVLSAMGYEKLAGQAIRVSGGWATTEDDWRRFAEVWLAVYGRISARHRATAA
jgi:cysteine desulfurase